MNAPANIRRETRPAWAKYLPVVAAQLPGTSREEARHRAGLMLLRDMASNGQLTAAGPSGLVLETIETIASRTALTPMTVEQLDSTRLALVRLYTGARDLEKVFGDHGGG